MLRCRCKHKHTDHDPNTRRCNKPSCQCTEFDSPWVCNCDHAWSVHEHLLVQKEVQVVKRVGHAPDCAAEGMLQSQAFFEVPVDASAGIASDVNNYTTLKRGSA